MVGAHSRVAARVREHRVSVVLNLENLDAEGQMRCAAAFLGGLLYWQHRTEATRLVTLAYSTVEEKLQEVTVALGLTHPPRT